MEGAISKKPIISRSNNRLCRRGDITRDRGVSNKRHQSRSERIGCSSE